MELKQLVSKLHPLERKIIPALKSNTELNLIAAEANLDLTETMRALQWLENKKVLEIISEKKEVVSLDSNGLKYQKEGLPEKKFLSHLTNEFQTLTAFAKKSKLSFEEINACIGLLKRKDALELKKEKELMIKTGKNSNLGLQESLTMENFLNKKFPLDLNSIKNQDRLILDELKNRKNFFKIEEVKAVKIKLTELGEKLVQIPLEGEVINRLTAGMLKTGEWKNKQFRAYDIEINVPKISRGKKHFVTESIDYIKSIWLEMGFKEMTGNYVQSAFWDLDSLFVPQDHPAREMQDTFYLHGKAKLPPLWKTIKTVHETGGNTNSKGWRYTYSQEESEKVLLRTHTTVLSAQTISKLKKEDLPAKFFAVGKVFRNEALDWKHLFEFDQVEGIVIDPNANLKHLKGYLREFYQKMGFSKIRMRPAHFPYTEPSLEVDVYHPIKKEWIELGGAGILRPEVVKPLLGFECPVLAWGQGLGRIIVDNWKITDLRDLYKNDLKQLREIKTWLK